MSDFQLSAGVLMVGSLYWQDDLNPGDGKRKKWREDYLEMSKSVDVKVPIRYGRLSAKGKNQTYTMILDAKLNEDQFGTAKAVPAKTNPITLARLLNLTNELSEVEGGKTNHFVKGSEPWCICGILINPMIEREIKSVIIKTWNSKLKENETGFVNFSKDPNLFSSDINGHLQIPWPENLDDIDLLVATATRPIGSTIVEPMEIARLIGNRPYFHPNIKKGIRTFQDELILLAREKGYYES
tara:strand:- start:3661 stop:4383 length:723 start_codon:yes stop_codon:yes gene_type:complete